MFITVVAKIVADTISQQLASNDKINDPDVNGNYTSNGDGNQKVRILQRPKTQKASSPIHVAVVEEKILKQPEEPLTPTPTDDRLQQNIIQDERVQQPDTPPSKEAKIITSP